MPSLRAFKCYEPPNWSPNTSWQVKKNHHAWVRQMEKMVHKLEPPVYPHEHMLVCSIDDDSELDGIIYAGKPHMTAQGELLIPVYVMARSLRSRGHGIGTSGLEQLEGIALEIIGVIPNIQKVLCRGVVHRQNAPCRRLLIENGWWEGEPAGQDYSEWWSSLAVED